MSFFFDFVLIFALDGSRNWRIWAWLLKEISTDLNNLYNIKILVILNKIKFYKFLIFLNIKNC